MDFFDFPERPEFDVVCLCLVVNFEGVPARRGDMLVRTTRVLHPGGHLFFVLPLACVNNSRYFTMEILIQMLEAVGYSVVEKHISPKLFFLMAVFNGAPKEKYEGKFPKQLLLGGKDHNNFHITL